MLDLAKFYYAFDQDSALFYTDQILAIPQKKSLDKLRAGALNVAGVSHLIKSDFELALKNHLEALKIRTELGDSTGIMESNLNIGNIYYRSGDVARGVESFKSALGIAKKINHERGMSLLYNNLGSYHLDQWKASKKQEDFDQAIAYLTDSKEIKERLNDYASLINTLNQLGELYLEKGNHANGEKMMNRALELSEQVQDLESRLAVLMRFSKLNRDRKDYPKSMSYAKSAYDIALEINSSYQVRLVALEISSLAEEMNDLSQAYEYLQVYAAFSDSLFNETRQKIRDELFVQYETEKKELENETLLKEKALSELSIQGKNEFLIGLSTLAFTLLIFIFILRRTNSKLASANEEITFAHQKLHDQNAQIQLQTETLQLKNKELTSANSFRGKLFSIISHDLRSPITTLQTSLALWKEGDLDKSEMEYILSSIHKNTETAATMLSNLLDWARVQISSDQLILTSLSVRELVNENIALIKELASDKNICLETNLDSTLNWTTDRERLNFILHNILKNAIKFTPPGGKISILGESNCLIVKDTGIGMSQRQIDDLLGRSQYSTLGTAGEQGTGIGFMLSLDFAESIGAHIDVKSEIGRGSEFKICF